MDYPFSVVKVNQTCGIEIENFLFSKEADAKKFVEADFNKTVSDNNINPDDYSGYDKFGIDEKGNAQIYDIKNLDIYWAIVENKTPDIEQILSDAKFKKMLGSDFVDLNDVVGVYTICNTGSLVVHKIDNTDDKVLVSLNGQNPEWCNMQEGRHSASDEFENGFYWGEMFVPFSEVIKV